MFSETDTRTRVRGMTGPELFDLHAALLHFIDDNPDDDYARRELAIVITYLKREHCV